MIIKKRKIPLEIIGSILILFIGYIGYKIDITYLEKNQKVDTCIAVPRKVGKNTDFYFEFKDIKYKRVISINKLNFVEGEKYLIRFDSLNPSNCQVLFTDPVFNKYESVDTIEGYITKKYNGKYEFEFIVHGIKYEKIGYYDQEKFDRIKIDSKFKIVYWIENPKRSILLLNWPKSTWSPAIMECVLK